MRTEYKSGRVSVEGRTFLLEFWKDDLKLPFVSASEILVEERKPHWWSRRKEPVEVKHEIRRGWTTKNRVRAGMNMIAEYLQKEKDDLEEHNEIEAFCTCEHSKMEK